MRNPFLFILPAIMMLSSCEKSITINMPDSPRKMVLNAVIVSGTNIHVHLTRTLSNAESGNNLDVSISNAALVLYDNNQAVDTLQYDKDGEYLSKIVATSGHHYKLIVTHPSYPTASAETDAPIEVPIERWDHQPNARGNVNSGDQDLLSIRIKDPAASGDYYILQVVGAREFSPLQQDFYSWASCVNISDPSFETPYGSDFPGEETCYPSNSLFLKDALFNGQEKELRLYTSSYLLSPYWEWQGTDTSYATVSVNHVTPQFYQFVKSYRSSQDASDNPFAEPANITSNVKGGYGIFTIMAQHSFQVEH